MSLFGTIQIANNALNASQIGLQVAGNNISNANTPGYIRQEAVFTPGVTQLVNGLPLGLGVRVEGIIQQVDRFLGERLRGSISDLRESEAREESYLQLESILGELGETDLSTSLNDFFASLNDILNQPEDLSVRNLAVLQGEILLEDIAHLESRVLELRRSINDEVVGAAGEINRLLEEVANLNTQIVASENSSTPGSEAVGLRDQRDVALTELATYVGIRAVEQPTGSVTVFAAGDFLVFEGGARAITVNRTADRGISAATLHIEDSDAPLSATTGRLAGLYAARDEILAGFLDGLQDFAGGLAFEFNKIYSSGQGLSGFRELTSDQQVSDTTAALDQAGLPFTPVNGSFQLQLRNSTSGLVETTDIVVDLNGLDEDTSLDELAAALDAIDGLGAEVTPSRQLHLLTDSADLEFTFANDTSGVLAALGLNVFFSGSVPQDLSVNAVLKADPGKLATSLGGVGEDARNAERLAGFAQTPLDTLSGDTITGRYTAIVSETTQASAVNQAVTEGFRVFQKTLEGQHLATAGVSIDDEAVRIIGYQRAYQASARLISTINDLLNFLINL